MCGVGKRFDFTCSGGDELSVITSVEKQDNLEVAYEALSRTRNGTDSPFWAFSAHHSQQSQSYQTYSPSTIAGLAGKCWGRIDSAIALGDTRLLLRHTDSISAAMSQVTLQKGPQVDLDLDSALPSALPRTPSVEDMELWRTQALFDLSRWERDTPITPSLSPSVSHELSPLVSHTSPTASSPPTSPFYSIL